MRPQCDMRKADAASRQKKSFVRWREERLYESFRAVNIGWRFTARTKFERSKSRKKKNSKILTFSHVLWNFRCLALHVWPFEQDRFEWKIRVSEQDYADRKGNGFPSHPRSDEGWQFTAGFKFAEKMTRKAFLPWRVIWAQGKSENWVKQIIYTVRTLQSGKARALHYRIGREFA